MSSFFSSSERRVERGREVVNMASGLPGLRRKAGKSGAKRERSWTGTPRMKPRPKPAVVARQIQSQEGKRGMGKLD